MVELEWTNDMIKRLIQEYRKRPMLWDVKNDYYRVQSTKYDAWMAMANLFGCDVTDMRKKLNSLFASHRREKARVRNGHRSVWFLYEHFNFLPSHVPNPPRVTVTYYNAHSEAETPAPPEEEEDFQAEYLEEDLAATPTKQPQGQESDHMQESDNYESDGNKGNQEVDYLSLQDGMVIKTEPNKDRDQPKIFVATHRAKIKSNRLRQAKLKAKRFPRVSPKKLRYTSNDDIATNLDNKLLETLKLLKKTDLAKEKDECDLFGEYIALALRKHDERTRSMIKQAINNIMFEQEMKKYGTTQTQYVVIDAREANPLLLDDTSK